MEPQKEFITINSVDVSTLPCNISRATLYKWNEAGKYPHLFKKVGGRVFVKITALVDLLERGE